MFSPLIEEHSESNDGLFSGSVSQHFNIIPYLKGTRRFSLRLAPKAICKPRHFIHSCADNYLLEFHDIDLVST